MILIKPSYKILNVSHPSPEVFIEEIGRVCYKSEEKIQPGTAVPFVQKILGSGHESVIEHVNITVKFIVDRGVTHELVRHRLASYSQESTRYCNYKGGVTFVIPVWHYNFILPGEYYFPAPIEHPDNIEARHWFGAMLHAEWTYLRLLELGENPQQARSVLPNSLKTEIVVTANLREWRHIFKLRTSLAAHPQMREIMVPLLSELKNLFPIFFEGIKG